VDSEAFRRFEREAHDRLAATYCECFAGATRGMIAPLPDGAGVRSATRVLDVACGPGEVAAAACARGARVSAVDLSPEMVALARRDRPALDVRESDAEALPFAAGAFDAVVCNFGLGHFPRPEVAAGEFARVLAAGGRLALSWWDLPRSRVNAVFLDASAAAGAPPPRDVPEGPPVNRFSNDGALRALLEGAGLRDVAVSTHSWTHHAPSVEIWWRGGLGGMARSAAAIRAQPPAMQQRIRAEFERLAAAHAADGGYAIPCVAKLGIGTRR
jgi:SAM-dependent methyltransferase